MGRLRFWSSHLITQGTKAQLNRAIAPISYPWDVCQTAFCYHSTLIKPMTIFRILPNISQLRTISKTASQVVNVWLPLNRGYVEGVIACDTREHKSSWGCIWLHYPHPYPTDPANQLGVRGSPYPMCVFHILFLTFTFYYKPHLSPAFCIVGYVVLFVFIHVFSRHCKTINSTWAHIYNGIDRYGCSIANATVSCLKSHLTI